MRPAWKRTVLMKGDRRWWKRGGRGCVFNNRDHAPRLFSPRNIARSRPKEAALPSEITESPCFNLYFFIFNGRATDKKRRVEYSINRGRRTFRHGRETRREKEDLEQGCGWVRACWSAKAACAFLLAGEEGVGGGITSARVNDSNAFTRRVYVGVGRAWIRN